MAEIDDEVIWKQWDPFSNVTVTFVTGSTLTVKPTVPVAKYIVNANDLFSTFNRLHKW